MSALVAALGCGLMMAMGVAAFAWYALRARNSSGEASEAIEAAALRAEVDELRHGQSDVPGDEFPRRR